MKNILDSLLAEQSSACPECFRFGNADGKVWIMPRRRMRTAMEVYQPSGRSGKLLKSLLPHPLFGSIVGRRIGAERLRLGLSVELRRTLASVFGPLPLEFSIFCGTPGKNRKITMQLSRRNQILGYCKFTDDAAIARLFDHEVRVLDTLRDAGVTGLPAALKRGRLADGTEFFLQSTVKTADSTVIHEWGRPHDEFVERLYTATAKRIPFDQTDYYRQLVEFLHHIDWIPFEEDRDFVRGEVLRVLADHKGEEMEVAACHCDFTPWNTFANGEELCVFDWEFGRLTYPKGLDRCHFFMQTAIFERRLDADAIAAELTSGNVDWYDAETFRMYLVEIMSRFMLREKGTPTPDVLASYRIWLQLLKHLPN